MNVKKLKAFHRNTHEMVYADSRFKKYASARDQKGVRRGFVSAAAVAFFTFWISLQKALMVMAFQIKLIGELGLAVFFFKHFLISN